MKKRGGIRAITVLVLALMMVASTITISVLPTNVAGAEVEDGNEVLTDNEIIPGELTKTFLEVTEFHAGAPVVYMNQDNYLYITLQNTGGNVGNDDYISCISQTRADTNELLGSTNRQSAIIMLGKAIQELDTALDAISNNQRSASLENIKEAVAFLLNAGRMDVDASAVISDLTTGSFDKVETILDEATGNFGSEHPDVKNATAIYANALSKLEAGQYTAAMDLLGDAFETVLGAYECNANLTVIDIIPKQSETIIDEPVIENLEAETSEVVTVIWHPTKRGIHYVKLNMSGGYEVFASPGTTVESPPSILSTGFPVSQATDEWVNWTFGKTIFDGDVYTYPSTGKTATLIKMEYGDLIIQNNGMLIFNDGVTFVIKNPDPGVYSITIQSGASFIIDSPSRSTTIQSPSSDPYYTYPFENWGTVEFLGADVTYTYGPSNLTQQGGIINHPGSVCELRDCWIVDADTHSIIANNSELKIDGSNTLVGKGEKDSNTNKGTGITILGNSDVLIDGITADYNEEYGIKCMDTGNQVRIENGATIKNGKTHGIWLQGSDAVIRDSFVMDNNGVGIYCTDFSNANIDGNEIAWNVDNGILCTASSNPVIANNKISSNGAMNDTELIYFNDLESGVSDWNLTNAGFWHLVNSSDPSAPKWNISHSGNYSWWYGQDATGDYNNTVTNWGAIKSPVISIPKRIIVNLTFWSWYETDIDMDTRAIVISNETTGKNVATPLYGDDTKTWIKHNIDITEFGGMDVEIIFDFNTDNNITNDYQGWYVDDIQMVASLQKLGGYGIWANNSSPSINNNTITENQGGVYLTSFSNATIYHNNISSNGHDYGMIVNNSNPTIDANKISNHSYAGGIFIKNASNVTIINNYFDNNTHVSVIQAGGGITSDGIPIPYFTVGSYIGGWSIQIQNSEGLIKDNLMYDLRGLEISNSSVIISDNYVVLKPHHFAEICDPVRGQIGIKIFDCNNTLNIENNTIIGSSGYCHPKGLDISYCQGESIIISNNTMSGAGEYDFEFWGTVYAGTVATIMSQGIRCVDSSAIIENNIMSMAIVGFSGSDCDEELRYVNNTINNTVGGMDPPRLGGMFLENCSFTIINSTISSTELWDFNLSANSHITTLNTTFNKSSVSFQNSLSNLTVQWFLHVKVVNETDVPVDGADVNVTDIYTTLVEDRISGADGWTKWIVATEYVQKKEPNYIEQEFVSACDGVTTDFYLKNSGIVDHELTTFSVERGTWWPLNYNDYSINNDTGFIKLSETLPVGYWLYADYEATKEHFTPHYLEASKDNVSAYTTATLDESKSVVLWLSEWATPTNLTPSSTNGTHPRIVADEANNTIHLVWLDDRSGSNQVFYMNSTDNGVTWNTECNLTSGANYTYYIDFANDGGHLAVVWEEKAKPSALPISYLIYSSDAGASWSTFELGTGSEPAVAVRGNDVYVAFRKWTGTGPDYILSMVIRWGYNGEVQEVEFLNPMGAELEFAGVPAVAAEGNNIHLTIADYTIPYIYHWDSSDSGGNWTDAEYFATYNGTLDAESISLDMRGDGLAFGWSSNGQIYTRTSADNGASWSGFNEMTRTTGNALHPKIIIDSLNRTHIVWQDNREGINNTFYMMLDDAGAVLIPETRLISTYTAIYPSVTVDSNGSAHIVWQEYRNGVWQVFYSKNK